MFNFYFGEHMQPDQRRSFSGKLSLTDQFQCSHDLGLTSPDSSTALRVSCRKILTVGRRQVGQVGTSGVCVFSGVSVFNSVNVVASHVEVSAHEFCAMFLWDQLILLDAQRGLRVE
jgi:hypothetical protein